MAPAPDSTIRISPSDLERSERNHLARSNYPETIIRSYTTPCGHLTYHIHSGLASEDERRSGTHWLEEWANVIDGSGGDGEVPWHREFGSYDTIARLFDGTIENGCYECQQEEEDRLAGLIE